MAVNVPGIGESIIVVPVLAQVQVPNISLNATYEELDLGEIYLDYPIKSKVTLCNHSS